MNNKDYFSNSYKNQSRILIVDDDPNHLEMLCDCIENHVSEIITSKNGTDAISKAKENQPDLILMDVMMPGMNGFDACKKIKADHITKDIPIIFITALNDLDSILKGFSCGGVDYIFKPFHTKEIISRLKIHLKLQFQQRHLMELAIELKATKEEAEAARIIAENANHAKTNFLYKISHELMTQMNEIINLTHFTLVDYNNSNPKNHIQKINDSSIVLKELIDKIYEYSTLEKGDVKVIKETFQLEEVLKDIYSKLYPKIKDKGQVQLVISKDPMIPNKLIGDAKHLEKLLILLGDNAIKFTPSGYVELKSRLLENKNNNVSIAFSVKDTGIGMKKAQKKLLFNPFSNPDYSKTIQEHDKMGLGLPLCNKLIKILEGKLSVNSTPGEGTIITFQLNFDLFQTEKNQ